MADMNKEKPENIKPYHDDEGGKKEQITKMFDNISGGYDFLNRLLSARFDVVWRRKLTGKILSHQPPKILDVATGTGDVAITLASKAPDVLVDGTDISPKMLEIARKKVKKANLENQIKLFVGDAENLDLEDNWYDVVTASFGVRNFENLEKGLSEMFRVTRPGGYIYILEFSNPRIFPVKQAYNFYFQNILPLIGRIRSGDPKAYQYLYESVQAFPDREKFLEKLQEVGFIDVHSTELTLGICQIYSGKK
ncbi:MAG TPA: bifunctional demethylmenaquinone methyltransferase/2-methoxy-6-polyprenyl-1,4-benzoquinol methylase UbiE [Membranihabitans sp.]|nr:bifunctional demethylmenaquinone methyltransferase/2-methoxy-6-polyprenyl-1,4-benzoquinol methylase UbiE [Membranihabitans sp.]